MTDPSLDRGRNAALTAIGQAFVLVGATAIGLLVAAKLGKSARVDAYFAANQVFAAALFVGQGIRTTVPGLELAGHSTVSVVRRATVWIALASFVFLVGAAFLGPLVLPSATHDGFTRDLLMLAPGGAVQIAGGYLAARLAMHQRFAGSALAYAGGTACNAVLLFVFAGSVGAAVLAPAALGGTLVAVAALVVLTIRAQAMRPPQVADLDAISSIDGHRPGDGRLTVPETIGRILLSVTPVLVPQWIITSAVIAAASVQSGGTTLLTYAFLALNAVATVAVAPIPIVLSSDLGRTWDRRPESLRPQVLAIVKVSMAVMVPAAAGLFLIGRPIAEALLTSLTRRDITQILELVAVLLPSLALTSASMVALVAIITLDRLPLLAKLLIGCAAGSTATVAVAVPLGATLGVLVALVTLWATLVAVAALWVVFRSDTWRLCAQTLRAAVAVAAPGTAALAAAWVAGGGVVVGIACTVAVGAVHGAWVRATERSIFDTLVHAVARR